MMKYCLLAALSLLGVNSAFAQGFPKYYKLLAVSNAADSLYHAGNFSEAAKKYDIAAAMEAEPVVAVSFLTIRYNAACSWALASDSAKAFSELDRIVSEMHYADTAHLAHDPDLTALHDTQHWNNLTTLAAANLEKKQRDEMNYAERTTLRAKADDIIFYPYSDYTRQFLDNKDFPFISIQYGNFRVHFRANSIAANHLPEIKHDLTKDVNRILSILDTNAYRTGIDLILVDSAGEMQELTGAPVHGGMAVPGDHLIFGVYKSGISEHELFHYIANDVWHYCYSRLLNEGSAVYAEDGCANGPLYPIAASMMKEHKLFAFTELVPNFDVIAREHEVEAYAQGAAMFKYLYERYGVAKMKRLWVEGFTHFESIYGITLAQFERDWTDTISKVVPSPSLDWEHLLNSGCR